jgi:uncharacterized membrane protein
MKELANFFKTTVLGGFFVVLPIVVLLILIDQMVAMLDGLIEPIAELFSVETVGGVEIALVLSVLAILLLCFIAGLVVRTGLGSSIVHRIEGSVLNRIPGYELLKNLTQRFSTTEATRAVVLARIHAEDAWCFAFVADELEDGRVVVFVPMAPTPTMGAIYVLPRENVREIAAGTGETMNCLMQWGIGAKDLVREVAPAG